MVLDPEGEPLFLHSFSGSRQLSSTSIERTAAGFGELQVSERAATLVGRRDGWEVFRIPLSLRPDRRNDVRG